MASRSGALKSALRVIGADAMPAVPAQSLGPRMRSLPYDDDEQFELRVRRRWQGDRSGGARQPGDRRVLRTALHAGTRRPDRREAGGVERSRRRNGGGAARPCQHRLRESAGAPLVVTTVAPTTSVPVRLRPGGARPPSGPRRVPRLTLSSQRPIKHPPPKAARVYTHTPRMCAHAKARASVNSTGPLIGVFSRMGATWTSAHVSCRPCAGDRGRPARCTASSGRLRTP